MNLAPPEPFVRVEPSALLGAKLAGLRRRVLAVQLGTGLALAVVVGVEMLGLAMFLDWWLELPWGVRLLSLSAQILVLSAILARFVLRPCLYQPDDDRLALLVERSMPGFSQRLIAAVQLSRPGGLEAGASRSLAEATIEQAEQLSEPVEFTSVVPATRARRLCWLAAAVLLIGLAGLLVGGRGTFDLLRRALLANNPVPRQTRVSIEHGDKIIGRGDDVRLEAVADGVIPSRGAVELRRPGRKPQRFDMDSAPDDRRRFARVLENVQESFDYQVYLNDGRSDVHAVKVQPRPAVHAIETIQSFPAYAGRPAAPIAVNDLKVLAGSKLEVRVQATQPVRSGQLRLLGTNVAGPLTLSVDAQQTDRLQGTLNIPREGLNGFAVEMVDTGGMASRDEVVYRIQIIPDRPPEVHLTYPERKEELVTRDARLLVGIEAADDFAVSILRLAFRQSDAAPAQFIELDMAGQRPTRIERRFHWDLAGVRPSLSEGTVLEYWIEAEDNNDVTGPGVGRSAVQVARVVSESEKRADLLNRAGDIFSSIADATEDQEDLNRRLGEIILEKTGP